MRGQAAYRLAGLLVVTYAALCVCSAAQAEPQKHESAPDKTTAPIGSTSGKAGLDMSKPYGYHLQPILDKIQASADQKIKITQVVVSYRSTIQPLRDQYREKQQQFIDSMISGAAAETIMARQMELGHLSSEITSKYCLMRLEVRRLLSPQQILLFESYGREHGWNH